MLRAGSLFSGAGLCDLGLHWAGLKHQWFCEVDAHCCAVLNRHWPNVPILGDIKTLSGKEMPPVDVLCGGFPCQDVSQGGQRAGIKQGTRSGLWFEYVRIITEIQPKYVIIENVRGLLSCGIETVLQELAAIGYDAEWAVLPAAACGAPHHRERVFIVAYPHGQWPDGGGRVLAPLQEIVGKHQQPWRVSDWLGIRFDRAEKASARHVYGGRVLCRVDDGDTTGLDKSRGAVTGIPANVGRISRTEARGWMPRLKALGNGIVPHQSYAVAACILLAEGLPVLKRSM